MDTLKCNYSTKVYNLKTGEEQYYSCEPRQAVISAWMLDNNLGTQLALGNYSKASKIIESDLTVACGDFVAKR